MGGWKAFGGVTSARPFVLLLGALLLPASCFSGQTGSAKLSGPGAGGTSGASGSAGSAGASGSSSGSSGSAGSSGSSSGSSGSAGASGSSAGTGGSSGGAGTGGTPDDCSATPAVDGTPCSMPGLSCGYDHCPSERRVTFCMDGIWQSSVSPCGDVACGGETCPSGQICSITAGGAQIATCIENTCGTGALSCDCLAPTCASCFVSGTDAFGFKVTCNTCPQGMQCP